MPQMRAGDDQFTFLYIPGSVVIDERAVGILFGAGPLGRHYRGDLAASDLADCAIDAIADPNRLLGIFDGEEDLAEGRLLDRAVEIAPVPGCGQCAFRAAGHV